MTEARDRLTRNEDIMAIYASRRRALRESGTFFDDSAEESPARTPFRWGNTPMTGQQGLVRVRAATGRGGIVVGRNNLRTPIRAIRRGQDNVPPRSIRRGQGRGTDLPSWYPRRPLGDITAITRAMQRRRGSLRDTEGLQLGTPTPVRVQTVPYPSYADTTPNAQLEHTYSTMKTPNPKNVKRPSCPPSVAKILLDVTSKRDDGENSDCLTPQRKLLNSIHIVSKVVMEELDKLNKTPSAKRAVRERKMRTLMSMR